LQEILKCLVRSDFKRARALAKCSKSFYLSSSLQLII